MSIFFLSIDYESELAIDYEFELARHFSEKVHTSSVWQQLSSSAFEICDKSDSSILIIEIHCQSDFNRISILWQLNTYLVE